MTFQAKILADSLSPGDVRLTTFELTYPRLIHAEFMTHRVFSRNAASSRAIPVKTLIERVDSDPFVPMSFGKNQPGMQASEELLGAEHEQARYLWLKAKQEAVHFARQMMELGVHKQLANRILEPFQWYTVICTATEWSNFFALRCHPDAQPEIKTVAELMQKALAENEPERLGLLEWHLPLTPDLKELRASFNNEEVKKISAGRCARVSYLTHDGKRDPQKDIELCERLVSSGHMSPLEHVATPSPYIEFQGNLRGWVQYRKLVPNEHDFSLQTNL